MLNTDTLIGTVLLIRTIEGKDLDRRSIRQELLAKINRLSPSLSDIPQANRLINLRRDGLHRKQTSNEKESEKGHCRLSCSDNSLFGLFSYASLCE